MSDRRQVRPLGRRPTRRRGRNTPQIVLLRPVGSGTPVHRLWAGTKLVAVLALSVTLSFRPYWPAIGLVAAFVAAAVALARVPLSARPRFGRWFWLLFLVGAALTLYSGGTPELSVGGFHLGLGGLDAFGRFAAFGFVLLAASLLVGWTTPAAELAPALAGLGAPLRPLRVPVDEWAVTVSLCVRSLPLLIDELRTLVAARRLRPRRASDPGVPAWQRWVDEAVDLVTASLVVAVRRAGEMAEAITARGGTATLTGLRHRPAWRDGVAAALVALVCAAAWVLPPG